MLLAFIIDGGIYYINKMQEVTRRIRGMDNTITKNYPLDPIISLLNTMMILRNQKQELLVF